MKKRITVTLDESYKKKFFADLSDFNIMIKGGLLMSWYLKVLKNYAGFTGRARRMEYWMFVLFNVIFLIIASILDSLLGINFGSGAGAAVGVGPIYTIYALAVLIPSIAVAVRRLHDIGKSGWWIFISLIPLVGPIWLLVLYFTDSQPGANEYGPNPKEAVQQP